MSTLAGRDERRCWFMVSRGLPIEWREVMPLLAEAGFRVIVPDYRGTGWSSKPSGGYDVARWQRTFALYSGHIYM